MTGLTASLAAGFARSTLSHVGRQFPYKPDIVIGDPADLRLPIEWHPVFHGSYDWHSCVHGWWQLLKIARLHPTLDESAAIRERADSMLTPDRLAGELAFVERPLSSGFERPYGWAWLIALHREAERHPAPWAAAIEPLALAFASRFRAFLPRLTYPLRAGVHSNIAFALSLVWEWAGDRDPDLQEMIRECALGWFVLDRNCQAWEPSGDEFLSPALCEANLMSLVLERSAFPDWFDAFLPMTTEGQPCTLFEPASVSDRSDGKIAHLDGLNLSRAWCWRRIAEALGPAHPATAQLLDTAQRHQDAALPWLDADYMGEHWLATFALLALDGEV